MKNQSVRILLNIIFIALLVAGGFGGPVGGARAAEDVPGASPVIYSVSISPAKAAAGDTIQMEAIFTVFDSTDRASIPVEFYYEIRNRGEAVFTSPLKTTNAGNGAKSHLGINIQAATTKGGYTVALVLIQSGRTVETEAAFSVVSLMEARQYRKEMAEKSPLSAGTIENRLLGEWKLEGQPPDIPASRIVFLMENDELAVRITRENAEIRRVKLRKTDTSLTIRSKTAETGGACWYVMEDVITFNDRMEDMPVRSTVLEGSGCVSVGQVSQSVLHRME